MGGFKRLGFLTKSDLAAEVKSIRAEADQKIQQAQQHGSIDHRLATEFPELTASTSLDESRPGMPSKGGISRLAPIL
jgi:hypothetical protein